MKNINLRLLFVGIIVLALFASALVFKSAPAAAQQTRDEEQSLVPQAVFTVNSTNDPGVGTCDVAECTLREAITAANGSPGLDDISFNITGMGPFTIQPVTELPAVTDAVSINGYTQSGSVQNPSCTGTATLQIVLNGALAPTGSNGLTLMTGASRVEGLVVNGFDGNGIEIMSDSNTIRGNFIGTNAAGTAAVPNNTNGVQITGGTSNSIGNGNVQGRNIISGNAGRGIVVSGLGGANATLIFGNYIGTSADGNSDLGNGSDGVDISQSANNVIGSNTATLGCNAGNLISGNNEDGINIFGTGATGNSVRGNLIGANAAGTAALGNTSQGVYISASNTTVGGATTDVRNIISGNGGGINIGGGANNTVQGNYIGTNLAGTAAIRRASGTPIDGVRIDGGANNNFIGGAASGEGNLISGNDVGVHIVEANDNRVRGNFIGTQADGTGDLGNFEAGVYIHEPTAMNNFIGGTATSDGNRIRFNGDGTLIATLFGEGGIVVFAGATQNRILANSITANTGLGIDLAMNNADGMTLNDPNDVDSGAANNLQNFPVITSATTSNTTTSIQGTLNSQTNRTYRIEFFSEPTSDGEGQTYLGTTNVTTTANVAVIDYTSPTLVPVGQFITATATDAVTGDTSEFSMSRQVTVPLIPTAASVTITGRVLTANGRGIRNVRLTLLNADGTTRSVVSSAFGYYRFDDVQVGETYIISASSKRYEFKENTRVLSVNEAVEGLNFVARN